MLCKDVNATRDLCAPALVTLSSWSLNFTPCAFGTVRGREAP